MPASRRRFLGLAAALALASPVAAGAFEPGNVECIAPANPGGGWDFTCRQVGKALRDLGIVANPVQVANMAGGRRRLRPCGEQAQHGRQSAGRRLDRHHHTPRPGGPCRHDRRHGALGRHGRCRLRRHRRRPRQPVEQPFRPVRGDEGGSGLGRDRGRQCGRRPGPSRGADRRPGGRYREQRRDPIHRLRRRRRGGHRTPGWTPSAGSAGAISGRRSWRRTGSCPSVASARIPRRS